MPALVLLGLALAAVPGLLPARNSSRDVPARTARAGLHRVHTSTTTLRNAAAAAADTVVREVPRPSPAAGQTADVLPGLAAEATLSIAPSGWRDLSLVAAFVPPSAGHDLRPLGRAPPRAWMS